MSKRHFLEEAIQLRARGLDNGTGDDVWAEPLGAWRRSEKAQTTIQRARQAFRRSFGRRHGAIDASLHR
jgi:hypothetical protein